MIWDPPKFNNDTYLMEIKPMVANSSGFFIVKCENSDWNLTMTCLIPMTAFSNNSLNPGTEIVMAYRLRNSFGWSLDTEITLSSSENAPRVVKEPTEVVEIYMGDKTSSTSIHIKWTPFRSLI
jgi:hypothetical protein